MVAYLKKRGHWVRAVDNNFHDYRKPLYEQADEILDLDLGYLINVLKAIEDCDWVIQLAADMGGVGYFHNNRDYYPYIANATINFNILQACEIKKVKRLFFAASACIYPVYLNGTIDSPELTEDMIYPADCDMSYGWEKLMMLRLCERAPFDARVGIFDTIYGPYQEKEGERMKFPTAIATKTLKALETEKSIEIWGDGTQQRVLLYIDDALDKIYDILTKDYHGAVNVCAKELVTVQQVAELCCNIVGAPLQFTYNLEAPTGVMARKSSSEKWEACYGNSELTSVETGFTKLIEWLQHAV
jgi:nucleoside-diphosphate-sugar epimerase